MSWPIPNRDGTLAFTFPTGERTGVAVSAPPEARFEVRARRLDSAWR